MAIPKQASWMVRKILNMRKTVFILWLALLSSLRTQDLLIKWGIDVNGTCVLCKNGLETQEHLLFHCCFSKKVWQEMLSWLGWSRNVGNWEQEYTWVQQTAKGRRPQHVLLEACFATTVYGIWIDVTPGYIRIEAQPVIS
ncbi:uncharacterized protein LOC132628987 [Lycium barbarum]|uniref:uncharacterized protein LOC132628987 n=1 Tax=Lycium barbarum TaxID=112863 RepID=UPI00293EB8D2|nr:uncharacterized protein LOC132628987 [Lycium barbarum]